MRQKIFTICFSLILTSGLLFSLNIQPAQAAADVEAAFVFGPEVISPTNSLQVGDRFTTTVRLSSASNQAIDTFGVYIDYDPAVLHVSSVTRLYPFIGFEFCTDGSNFDFDNGTGKIFGQCADLGGSVSASNLDVVKIEFEVIQTNTTFDLRFDDTCNGVGNAECFQALRSGVDQVDSLVQSDDTPTAVFLNARSASKGGSIGLWFLLAGLLMSLTLFNRAYYLSAKPWVLKKSRSS